MSCSTKQMTFGFPKSKRIRDPELLAVIRTFPCLACEPGTQGTPTEAHHVTTRGAGGDDVPQNIMPLCAEHHQAWHMNPRRLILSAVRVRGWLVHFRREDVFRRHELPFPKG